MTRPRERSGALRAVIRVGRARYPATDAPDEWPSPGYSGDRTRLTGRL